MANKGVLVVVAGGNISLVAAPDPFRRTTVIKPGTLGELRVAILGSQQADSITFREGSVIGEQVRVEFTDVRQSKGQQFTDPEEFDSSGVQPPFWRKIANLIVRNYKEYEGFVVLHGLDTMAYSASALAFMFENLSKPVIFTGAQRPLNYARTDAVQNVISSIALAASSTLGISPVIPEVVVFSYDGVFRGNRVSMSNATSYHTFDSPNFPPLASVGEHIEIQSHLVQKIDRRMTRINPKTTVKAKIAIIDVYPGMDANVFNGLEMDHGLKGVLLRTYGMGTAPTSPEVLVALDALAKTTVVMIVTQARSGSISHGLDPISLRLFEHGVISGVDMTAEAGYAKMVVLLSQDRFREETGDLLQLDMCGEQSQSIFYFHFDKGETEVNPIPRPGELACFRVLEKLREMSERHRIQPRQDAIRYIQLRLLGAKPAGQEKGVVQNRAIEFSASLVDPGGEEGEDVLAVLTRDILHWSAAGRETVNVAYDVTEAANLIMSPETMLRVNTTEPIEWKRLVLAVFADAGI